MKSTNMIASCTFSKNIMLVGHREHEISIEAIVASIYEELEVLRGGKMVIPTLEIVDEYYPCLVIVVK